MEPKVISAISVFGGFISPLHVSAACIFVVHQVPVFIFVIVSKSKPAFESGRPLTKMKILVSYFLRLFLMHRGEKLETFKIKPAPNYQLG